MADREPPPPAPIIPVPKVGRPSKYDPEQHPQRLLALAAQGYSDARIAAEMLIAKATLYRWAEEHPDFATALTHARSLQQAWWEAAADTGYAQAVIGPQVWKHSINNRFKAEYADRSEQAVTTRDGDRADMAGRTLDELLAMQRDMDERIAARQRAIQEAAEAIKGAGGTGK